MKIACEILGTRGDVQPMVALAQFLKFAEVGTLKRTFSINV
jgi:hypothetical protein